ESSGRSNLALATCDPSLVTWADPNSTISPCAGPFEYFPVCYKSSPRATGPLGGDVACGIDAYVQKTCYPSCRNTAFGYDSTAFTTTPYQTSVLCGQTLVCDISPDYVGGKKCWYVWNCASAASVCADSANSIIAGLDPAMPRTLVSYTATSTPAVLPTPTGGGLDISWAINITTPQP